jgi:hypothetical protein
MTKKEIKMNNDFSTLTLVETDDFSAWLRSIDSLPASEVLPLLDAEDSGKQFSASVELVKQNLAPDLVDAFNSLTMRQTLVFITQWFRASSEK